MMDDRELIQDLSKRFVQLDDRRKPYEDTWKEITEFVLPRRSLFEWAETKRGGSRTATIFDGTAQQALLLLADGLQGYITSPSTDWFNLSFQDDRLMQIAAARQWMQEAEEEFYSIFQGSNFYETMSEVFLDGGSVGTATMYIEEDLGENLVSFLARHPKEIFIAENRYGRVDTVFRKFYLTNRVALEMFGENAFEDADGRKMKEAPYDDAIYFHAVFPRKERDPGKIDAGNKPFASVYWRDGKEKALKKGGYDSLPYVVWRWRTNTEEEYGRSPAWDALSDIKRSQEIGKTMMKAAQLAVEPPVNYPSEFQGQIEISPRGMNPYTDPKSLVFPMDVGGNYPIGRDREEALQAAIREHFRVDFFLLLSQMQSRGEKITATQVMEMQGEKAAVLGAIVGRINNELLNPVFERVFDIAYRSGRLPEIPEELMEQDIKIDYLGPLAQAQRRYYSTQGVNQALSQLLPLVEYYPEMRDLINADELGKHLLISNGMPERILQDEKVIEESRKQRAEKAQAMEQAEMAEKLSGAVKNIGSAPMSQTEKLRQAV